MKQSSSSLSTGGGLKLFTCEWLPDDPPRGLVLLIHGLGEHSGRYQHVAEYFNREGLAFFGFDLPGHGQSGGSRGHIPSYDLVMDTIDDLLTQIRQRFPAVPLFLYGHSLGGNLALYYLLHRNPLLTGAVVTSPGLRTAEKVPAWKTSLGKILYRLAPSFTMDNGLDVTGLSHNQAVIDAYKADPLVHPLVSARLGLDLINNGRTILEHASQLHTLLLLMVGSADRIIDPGAVREFAQKAGSLVTFREWPDGYHELHNEPQQMQVLKTMADWIKDRINKKAQQPAS